MLHSTHNALPDLRNEECSFTSTAISYRALRPKFQFLTVAFSSVMASGKASGCMMG